MEEENDSSSEESDISFSDNEDVEEDVPAAKHVKAETILDVTIQNANDNCEKEVVTVLDSGLYFLHIFLPYWNFTLFLKPHRKALLLNAWS